MKKIFEYSMQGKRPSNEDYSYILLNNNGENNKKNKCDIMGVFDGHGGNKVSHFLQKKISNLHKTINDLSFIYKNTKASYSTFNKLFNFLNKSIKLKLPIPSKSSGSTLCLFIGYTMNNNYHGWVLNVGDSRIIMCNQHNKAMQLSHDHKPNTKLEKERIKNLGGEIKYDGVDWRIKGYSLSRAFGDFAATPFITHKPEINHYTFDKKEKFIVIACDGLWDVLSNQEVVDFILMLIQNKNTHNIAEQVSKYAFNKGSLDNITVIVYFF